MPWMYCRQPVWFTSSSVGRLSKTRLTTGPRLEVNVGRFQDKTEFRSGKNSRRTAIPVRVDWEGMSDAPSSPLERLTP